MFELACQFLSSPWRIWKNGDLTQRRAVLKLAFAERPHYCRSEGLRTRKTILPFNMLGDFVESEGVMAERQGFEPWVGLHPQRFSRPPRSTTPAPLRSGVVRPIRTYTAQEQDTFRLICPTR